MGLRNEVRPGEATRDCDEMIRGRTRFCEAEAFTIFPSKGKKCKVIYKIAYLDIYLG